jgi:hypothetical protein
MAVDTTSSDITPNVIPAFPSSIPATMDYTLICPREYWAVQQEKEVAITIETLLGYEASYTCRIPSVS